MGKNAKEMPLVKWTFKGASLGNAVHLTLSTTAIRFLFVNPSDYHHFRLLCWENDSRLQLPNAFHKDPEICSHLLHL